MLVVLTISLCWQECSQVVPFEGRWSTTIAALFDVLALRTEPEFHCLISLMVIILVESGLLGVNWR